MSGRTNPFNPNSVVTPTLFAGRHDQVLQILKKLTQVREGMPASFVYRVTVESEKLRWQS